eukprot:3349765-Prymnesium_polylepis.2
MQPFNRIEAHRLLARAAATPEARCGALKAAADEAAQAEYWWLEVLTLRDLLAEHAGDDQAEGTTQRLASALKKLHASDDELQPFLGAGHDVSALRSPQDHSWPAIRT